jgi:4-carboxymuconolactone decarboxylase
MPTGGARCAIDTIEYQDRLRSLALNDDAFVGSVLGMGVDTVDASRLDARTHALVRVAVLVSVGATPSTYHASVEAALAAGACHDEIVGILVAVAPTIGLARVVSAAPQLALALGYDVDDELE